MGKQGLLPVPACWHVVCEGRARSNFTGQPKICNLHECWPVSRSSPSQWTPTQRTNTLIVSPRTSKFSGFMSRWKKPKIGVRQCRSNASKKMHVVAGLNEKAGYTWEVKYRVCAWRQVLGILDKLCCGSWLREMAYRGLYYIDSCNRRCRSKKMRAHTVGLTELAAYRNAQ